MNPGASGNGYIATDKLSVGAVESDMDEGLEHIVSYDAYETTDAYMDQINVLTACGLNYQMGRGFRPSPFTPLSSSLEFIHHC